MRDVSYKDNRIFVHFSHNMLPMHIGQYYANRHYGGAILNRAGFSRNAYAIPIDNLTIGIDYEAVKRSIEVFLNDAIQNPDLEFYVYGLEDSRFNIDFSRIIPLFKHCPNNCFLPDEWCALYEL